MQKAKYVGDSPLDNPEPSHEGIAFSAGDSETYAFYPENSEEVGYYVSRSDLQFN